MAAACRRPRGQQPIFPPLQSRYRPQRHVRYTGATYLLPPRHHLFVECRVWAPQIRRLWQRVAGYCRWWHPRAPALRELWKEGATGAVLGFLGDALVGSRLGTGRGGVLREAGQLQSGKRCRKARRAARAALGLRFVRATVRVFIPFVFSFCSSLPFSLFWRGG